MSTEDYELIAYDSGTYECTHPNRLGLLAYLLGLKVPPLQGARILEIGCADGMNLIPMAYTLPDVSLTGFDLSPTHIQRGKEYVRELGLSNVTLEVADIMDFDFEAQSYDFVIAHGIYSWVPPLVRAKMLEGIKRCLTPNGLAYVSYNTLPGWYAWKSGREFLLYMTQEMGDAQVRTAQACSLAQHLIDSYEQCPYPRVQPLLEASNFFKLMSPSLLAHGPLASINQPVYFSEFHDAISKIGLRYLADASNYWTPPQHPLIHNFGFSALMVDKPVKREQVLDFLENRSFRRSILSLQDCDGEVDLRRISQLRIRGKCNCVDFMSDSLLSDTPLEFRSIEKKEVCATVSQCMTKVALIEMQNYQGRFWSYDGLRDHVASIMGEEIEDEEEVQFRRNILSLFLNDMVELQQNPSFTFVEGMGDGLVAHPFSRVLARTSDRVPNYSHQSVILSKAERMLLPYLDGRNERADLQKSIEPSLQEGDSMDSLVDSLRQKNLLIPVFD